MTASVAEDNVVNWNKNELDDISDESHNYDTHHRCLQYLGVLGSIRPGALVEEVGAISVELSEVVNDSF